MISHSLKKVNHFEVDFKEYKEILQMKAMICELNIKADNLT